jgi:hypothetical protein
VNRPNIATTPVKLKISRHVRPYLYDAQLAQTLLGDDRRLPNAKSEWVSAETTGPSK